MATRPKASDWEKDESIINAGIRGFNALTEIPRIFKKEIPWLNDYKFMFCSDSDIPEMVSIGWRHINTEMFSADEWNKATPLKLNVTSVDGNIKYRENYLMIQHAEYREKVEKLRNQAAEKQFESAVSASGQVHPEDPRAAEMKVFADELTTMDVHRVQGTGTEEPDRGE